MKSEERRAKSEERRAKSEERRAAATPQMGVFQLKGLFMLKNVRMQGAKERAAEHTSVCEQRRDAVNAADGRFSA
ncbi:hypothetical protein [Geotalea toluenoxydans]